MDIDQLPIKIAGVDLVEMFRSSNSACLTLVQASLSNWRPPQTYDLRTCVHGLHYIGDKLGLISSAATWLNKHGRFTANLDMHNIELRGRSANRVVAAELRKSGFDYSFRHRLIQCDGRHDVTLAFWYLGADDEAGPNYTGQPAVNSHYEKLQ